MSALHVTWPHERVIAGGLPFNAGEPVQGVAPVRTLTREPRTRFRLDDGWRSFDSAAQFV
jgi:hypothetical protein